MKLDEVIEEACVKFRTSRNDIFSQRRNKGAVSARKVIYKILTLDGKSTTRIGQIMHRDHSSIVVGIKSLDENKELSEFATYLYLKYREDEEVSQEIDEEAAKRLITNCVKKYYNKGLTEKEISEELDLKEDTVDIIIKTIKRTCPIKKVPCYDKGTYRTIYL
jgi:DNA-binding CsgD family transcriptional regulator